MNARYSVEPSQVVIPIGWDSQTLHLLAGLELTLVLAGRDEDGLRWVVRLKGMAELSVLPTRSAGLRAFCSGRPAHGVNHVSIERLLIPVYRLNGYRETLLGAAAKARLATPLTSPRSELPLLRSQCPGRETVPDP